MSMYMIRGWRGMIDRMVKEKNYRWRAHTGLFLGTTAFGVFLMFAISPDTFKSTGYFDRIRDTELRSKYGIEESSEPGTKMFNRKWNAVQQNRLQELLNDVKSGDSAAMDRRWTYAMRGKIPEANENAKQQLVRRTGPNST